MGALGRCASVFLYWRTSQVRQCILACFRFFCLTSFVHIFFIRTPIYANSDSISRIFPRRTQWRNPFPLFLLLKINYTLIFNSYVYRKYGVLHSPLLRGFRPRNLQVKKNVSYYPITHLLNHHPQASIVLRKLLMLYEHMQKCVYMFLI